jgi:multidrug efflux pump subunit AcrA (membrane-fusion protein)
LIEPAGRTFDTVLVTRGNVERVALHHRYIQTMSDGLYFTSGGLGFGELFCREGQYVTEGQLLLRLDTEPLEERIEAKRETIRQMTETYNDENELIQIDLDILKIELEELIAAYAGARAVEAKRKEIELQQLLLDQARERQALLLGYEESELDELLFKIVDAELRAPYDGPR